MSRNFLINISGSIPGDPSPTPVDLWLTSDGTETGRRCKTAIPAYDTLKAAQSGKTSVGRSGKPFNEKALTDGAGRPFEIQIVNLKTTVFADLKTFVDAMENDDLEARVIITGEPGDIDVDAVVNYAPVPLGFGRFTDGIVKDVVLRLITTEINAP